MVLVLFIGLLGLIVHAKDFTKIRDSQERPTDERYPIFLLLNIAAMFAGGIGFGRPYLPIAVSFCGLLVIAFKGSKYVGFNDWLEKLFMVLSVISLIGEYIFIGISYWIKANKKEEIRFLIILLCILSLMLFYYCYNYV
jgi:hypothetical protein